MKRVFQACISLLVILYSVSLSAQEVDTLKSGVVKVKATKVGTGFIVKLEADVAYIVTASHVVEGAREIEVEFFTRRNRPIPAKVLHMEGGDPQGLALLLVEGKIPSGLSVLKLNSSISVRERDPVITIGFPRVAGVPWAPLDGKIVGLRGKALVFSGAAAEEGSSGGPLIKDEQVIGVVTEVSKQFAYAVRAVIAQAILEGWEVKLEEVAVTRPRTITLEPPPKPTPKIQGMVFVRGGCFQMGDIFGDGTIRELPVHEVCVDDFYIGKYEVTQKEWREVMGNKPSKFKGCDDCPVEQVSWNDIQVFIEKLSGQTGKRFRLPTEAEWEYAARSGGKEEKWAGTSDESEIGAYAWYGEPSAGGKPHSVGQKRPNGLGLYDMSGNVCELVSDWYGEDYYSNSPRNNPKGPPSGKFRVARGGTWDNGSRGVRASQRYWVSPDFRSRSSSFRLALSAQ